VVSPAPDESGSARVLRTGRAEIYPVLLEVMGRAPASEDAEWRASFAALEPRSAMLVPLVARGRTLGVLSVVAAESGRRYGETDLAFCEELARRAAVAVDNARLYRAAQVAGE